MDKGYITREEFNVLDEKVDELQNEQTKTKQRVEHMEKKLDKIEDNTTWILRLTLGAIILAILAFVLQSPETNISTGGFISGK